MDSEAIRKKRLEDIEQKKKRLAEMRKSREESAAAPPVAAPAPAPAPVPVPVIPTPKNDEEVKAETEELVSSLLATVPPVKSEPAPSAQPLKSRAELLQEKLQRFSTVKCSNTITILPSVTVKYDKSCQTEVEDQLFLENPAESNNEEATEYEMQDEENENEAETASIQGRTPTKGLKSPSPSKTLFSNSKQTGRISAELEAEAVFAANAQTKLSDEERATITSNRKFQDFLHTKSLYIERALALAEEHDVLRDFSVDDKGTTGDLAEHAAFQVAVSIAGSSSAGTTTATAGATATTTTTSSAVASVYEEDSLAGRPVMDLRWSPLVTELFLAAYGAKAAPSNKIGGGTTSGASGGGSNSSTAGSASSRSATAEEEAPGVVCVWSKDLHSRPEYRFTASSPVLAAVFHTQEQNLVIGGCYSGQILLWDMKLNKSLPVQRSSMSGQCTLS